MSTYPGALDALTNPAGSDHQNTVSHAGQHAAANDAIEAIQATLGINPQGDEDDVAARLDALEAGGGGGGGGGGDGWEVVDSDSGTTLGRVTLDAILDDAYEYELDVHAISASGGPVNWTLFGRLAGASITSGSYFGGGWAQSWGGGFVDWALNSATSRPMHYSGANNLTATFAFRRADTSLWTLDVPASRSGSSSIVCSALGFIASDMDGIDFGPASGTWHGEWSLRRRLIPT